MNDLKNELKKRKINSKESLHSLILDLYHGKNQAIMVRTLDIGFDIIKNNGDFTSEIRCKLKLIDQLFYSEEVANKILNIWINLIDKNQNSSLNQNSLFYSRENISNDRGLFDRDSFSTNKTSPPRYSGKRFKKWFIYLDGKEKGPYNNDEIETYVNENIVMRDTPIWKDGMSNWVDLEEIEEFDFFEITFSEKRIDETIREELNVDKSYEIRKKDLLKIAELRLYNNKISDISALKNLKNLTILYLHSNKISDISALKELKNLAVLFLSNNKISDISALKELKNLIFVDLKNNPIKDYSPIKHVEKVVK